MKTQIKHQRLHKTWRRHMSRSLIAGLVINLCSSCSSKTYGCYDFGLEEATPLEQEAIFTITSCYYITPKVSQS